MLDTTGREYAKYTELQPGDYLQVDAGFSCVKPWSVHKVHETKDDFYIHCDDGRHLLSGQIDNGDGEMALVGMYKVTVHG